MQRIIILVLVVLALSGCETTKTYSKAPFSKIQYSWDVISDSTIKVQKELEARQGDKGLIKSQLNAFAEHITEGRKYKIVYGPITTENRQQTTGHLLFIPIKTPIYKVYIQSATITLLEGSGFDTKQFSSLDKRRGVR